MTINQAAALLHQGGLVAFPTETVYGLGADASNEAALRKIFAAKERPLDHPLIVHISDVLQLNQWARDVPPAAMKLAQAFWPGPLTIILKKQPSVLPIVTAGQDTVGLRIPNHPIALALLTAFGGGVAAPSANKFTHISPTTAAAVQAELGGEVDLILDGGNCTVGLESTIIDLSREQPVLLRPGMITREAIESVLGEPVLLQQDRAVIAPGMHEKHYAPTTRTQLVSPVVLADFLHSNECNEPIAILALSPLGYLPPPIKVVQMPTDAAAYAKMLYRTLRELDNEHYSRLLIEAVPCSKEWAAIRDRIQKASQ